MTPQEDDALIDTLTDDVATAVRDLQSVEALDEPVRQESVDEAHKILRWLRNLQSTDRDIEEWLDVATPAETKGKAASLLKLVRIFARKLRKARKQRPNIVQEDMAVEDAAHAAAAIAFALLEYARYLHRENQAQTAKLDALLSLLPAQAQMRQSQSVRRLLDMLAGGFDRIAGKNASRSAGDRLLDLSQRIQANAMTLRTVDAMEAPVREESIELAREIMRRFKTLPLGDKPLKDVAEAGQPEDKAALAQKIDEMVEVYRSLVFEAAQGNPGLMNDPQVKEANQAMGFFAHAVKLMAAKEIPVSAAATQQISADIAQSPDEWKDLHDRTASRLARSAEGGLDKAIDEIMAQQQEQQEQDMAEDLIDSALSHSDQKRRRKKRKGGGAARSGKGGKGGKKQLKQLLDLAADDFALKQGRFSDAGKSAKSGDASTAAKPQATVENYVLKEGQFDRDARAARGDQAGVPPPQGLPAEALAAIRQVGGSLRDIGNQIAMTPVDANAKIIPDDKTITQRVVEDELRKGPKNTGPRV